MAGTGCEAGHCDVTACGCLRTWSPACSAGVTGGSAGSWAASAGCTCLGCMPAPGARPAGALLTARAVVDADTCPELHGVVVAMGCASAFCCCGAGVLTWCAPPTEPRLLPPRLAGTATAVGTWGCAGDAALHGPAPDAAGSRAATSVTGTVLPCCCCSPQGPVPAGSRATELISVLRRLCGLVSLLPWGIALPAAVAGACCPALQAGAGGGVGDASRDCVPLPGWVCSAD